MNIEAKKKTAHVAKLQKLFRDVFFVLLCEFFCDQNKSSKFELVDLEARIACHIRMWEHLDFNCPLYQGLSNKFAVTDAK